MAIQSVEGLITLVLTALLIAAGYLVAGVIRRERWWIIGGSIALLFSAPLLLLLWRLERERVSLESLLPYLFAMGVLLGVLAAGRFLRRRGSR